MTMEPAVFAAIVVTVTLTVMFFASIFAGKLISGVLRVARGKPTRKAVKEHDGNHNGQ